MSFVSAAPGVVQRKCGGILKNVARIQRSFVSTVPPDYSRYFSKQSLARKPSPIRALTPLVKIPGMLSLGGGRPNPETFPFECMSLTLKGGKKLEIDSKELNDAMQYSPTPGMPKLVDTLISLQRHIHKPPELADNNIALAVTTGSQEALSRAFAMLLNPDDSLIVEKATYSGSLAYLKPLGCNLVGADIDDDGLLPDSLEMILDGWEDTNPNQKKPRVLYTIPTGANPTGGTQNFERRQQVYKIAQKHDLIVLEDDPYYYLQFSPERVRSYLNIDTDARVLRFDSFSKVLSAGIRVGTVTGPKKLVDQLCLHTQAVNLHASGFSQIAVQKLFEDWGIEGFEQHVDGVCKFYRSQCDAFQLAAEKHLKGLAEWSIPSAGMFVWIKALGVEDTLKLISEEAKEAKVLLVPGMAFMLDDSEKSSYMRASYSTCTPEDMDVALERLADILRAHAK